MNYILTPEGDAFVANIASRHGISETTAKQMLAAVKRGNGTMAQFQTQEFGSGQWMRGGMTMVGDMFNHGMKARVNDLCSELSAALADGGDFFKQPEEHGSGGGSGMSMSMGMSSGGNWWPAELGTPTSSGAQNHIRYAVFPGTRRLAIERAGKLTIYDTSDHVIGGVSQQQGGDSSLSFSSQHGTIAVSSLPVVAGASVVEKPRENRNFAVEQEPKKPDAKEGKTAVAGKSAGTASASTPGDPAPPLPDVLALLEKLGSLRDGGVLTAEEFAEKKKDLLSRL
ncbi:SHOCT domain-containing protein [Luteolibacter arcticus]|uniref:SHOCT domain-containing protein n=1 Tax=Luteolibacter arcticus TaxID=1581411 RepID=A0ABT3GSA5_9BACT|nr:SHOCT domain-containing protein [Luteolibacter arcticus]MCW1926414.1 SHOCT domain-containing protein [Luteolibacter arcticus]